MKLALIMLVAQTINNAKSKGAVVTNAQLGETSVDIPDFSMAELAVLPRSLFRYQGGGV